MSGRGDEVGEEMEWARGWSVRGDEGGSMLGQNTWRSVCHDGGARGQSGAHVIVGLKKAGNQKEGGHEGLGSLGMEPKD